MAAPTHTANNRHTDNWWLEEIASVLSGVGATGATVDLASLISGENQTLNRMMVAPLLTYHPVISADTQIKAGAGVLGTVTFTCNDAAPTAGTIIGYDSLTETGTQLFNHTFTTTPFLPLTLPLFKVVTTGIYIGFTTTADVNVSIGYL